MNPPTVRCRAADNATPHPPPPIPPPSTPENFSMYSCQILADVFNAPVYLKTVPDAAAIGAALRAKHGWLCAEAGDEARKGGYVPFSRVLASSSSSSSSVAGEGRSEGAGDVQDKGKGYGEGLRLAASPRGDAAAVYEGMAER